MSSKRYVIHMDFRKTHCSWCSLRTNRIENCSLCPKYRRYELKNGTELSMDAFCSICINRNNKELEVFCKTNRSLQEDSGEDFDCYQFCIRVGAR